MPSPQVENGYTRIANALFEVLLRFPFSKVQLKVVLAVVRQTYGFNKKQDDLGLSRLAALTAIDKADCSRAVQELVAMRVLTREDGQWGW